jgi:hypothetical protein
VEFACATQGSMEPRWCCRRSWRPASRREYRLSTQVPGGALSGRRGTNVLPLPSAAAHPTRARVRVRVRACVRACGYLYAHHCECVRACVYARRTHVVLTGHMVLTGYSWRTHTVLMGYSRLLRVLTLRRRAPLWTVLRTERKSRTSSHRCSPMDTKGVLTVIKGSRGYRGTHVVLTGTGALNVNQG